VAKLKKSLTEKQKAVLEFIRNQIVLRGHPPTVREIGTRFGIRSTNGVRTHLTALTKKGYIKKQQLISRGIELVSKLAQDIVRVPLVGSVPAGLPIDAVENIESEYALDQSFLPKGEVFSLRVTGDSMKNAGILDGDIVMVRKQNVAQKGEIVVALLNGEATVKRFSTRGKQVLLKPENDDFETITINKRTGEFRILGKVVGLLRRIK
jgi:repressor LexA